MIDFPLDLLRLPVGSSSTSRGSLIEIPWDLERDLCSGYSVSIGNPK